MLPIILHPRQNYITLLLLMRGTTSQPQRIPANSPQNPFTYSLNSPLSPHPNFHSISSANDIQTINQNIYPGSSRPNRELVEHIDISDNSSFARNFKGRLYGFDANEDVAKQEKMKSYREQLLQQAEQARIRKLQQKRRQEEEDMKREREYNEGMKIQAQKKAVKKDQHSYFMMRTSRGKMKNVENSRVSQAEPTMNNHANDDGRAKLAEEFSKKDNLKRTFHNSPKIIKRGGYHNQSSLDKSHPNPQDEPQYNQKPQQPQRQNRRQERSQRPQRPQRVRVGSQQQQQLHRISQIMLFQNNMLKKLENFKKQIIIASKSFKLDDELQKVKLKLRAKPLNMAKIHSLNTREGVNNLMQRSSFYHLPMINTKGKIYEGSREAKMRDPKQSLAQSQLLEQPERRQVVKLEDKRRNLGDDKNYVEPLEQPQNNDFAIQADED